MLSRPPDLGDDHLVAALHRGWGISASGLEYLPVGFGSHHWAALDDRGNQWFVSVDHLDRVDRLRAALSTARRLRDSGLDFVIAPIAGTDGDVLHVVLSRFAVAVYPHVEGEAFAWDDLPKADNRRAVVDVLARLHAAPPDRAAYSDEFELPERAVLAERLGDTGPYASRTSARLRDARAALDAGLTHYDDLVRAAAPTEARTVVTHGEPHPGNTMHTDEGWVLVDWDTLLLAPAERDLWWFGVDDWAAYEASTGVTVNRALAELYRARWDLKDLCEYVMRFHRPHTGDEDDEKSWKGVCTILDRLARG